MKWYYFVAILFLAIGIAVGQKLRVGIHISPTVDPIEYDQFLGAYIVENNCQPHPVDGAYGYRCANGVGFLTTYLVKIDISEMPSNHL